MDKVAHSSDTPQTPADPYYVVLLVLPASLLVLPGGTLQAVLITLIGSLLSDMEKKASESAHKASRVTSVVGRTLCAGARGLNRERVPRLGRASLGADCCAR